MRFGNLLPNAQNHDRELDQGSSGASGVEQPVISADLGAEPCVPLFQRSFASVLLAMSARLCHRGAAAALSVAAVSRSGRETRSNEPVEFGTRPERIGNRQAQSVTECRERCARIIQGQTGSVQRNPSATRSGVRAPSED